MTKLYKAVDKLDGKMSCFMVSDQGVTISSHGGNDNLEIEIHKEIGNVLVYDGIEEFKKRAINPVLIAEW